MFRTTDIVLIVVMISAAAFTYRTKHEADNELDHIHKLQRAIAVEQDRIDVLKADWSLLRQPARLQKLTENYHDELQLEPVGPHQIVRIDDLPTPPIEIEDVPDNAPGALVDNGTDTTATGSIAR